LAFWCTQIIAIKIRGFLAKGSGTGFFDHWYRGRHAFRSFWGIADPTIYYKSYTLLSVFDQTPYTLLLSCTFLYLKKKNRKNRGLGWYKMGYEIGTGRYRIALKGFWLDPPAIVDAGIDREALGGGLERV
jgi:hypothetical protein